MSDVAAALAAGVMLGLAAGVAPGPLMTLVLAHTLRHGPREGLLVAAAPLITDVPIILLCLFVLRHVANSTALLPVIGLAGSAYLLYVAYETQRARPPVPASGSVSTPGSLRTGVTANALNPHPYLFWMTVGVPLMLSLGAAHPLAPWIFVAAFYLLLVGSKVVLVVLVGRYRSALTGRLYPYLMRALGLALAVFAVLLLRDSLHLLGLT